MFAKAELVLYKNNKPRILRQDLFINAKYKEIVLSYCKDTKITVRQIKEARNV